MFGLTEQGALWMGVIGYTKKEKERMTGFVLDFSNLPYLIFIIFFEEKEESCKDSHKTFEGDMPKLPPTNLNLCGTNLKIMNVI